MLVNNLKLIYFFKMINGSIWSDSHEPFRRAFVREMGHDGENMIAGNVMANKMANSVKRNWRLDIEEANLYGAGIKFKKLWMTNQYHNSELLAQHGPDSWIRDMLKAIDEDATIENIKHFYPELAKLSDDKFDLEKFLANTHQQIANGRTTGSGILAEQFRLHRIFQFKSADTLWEYNVKYGHKNLAHAILQNQEMFQKYLTIGETMGFGRETMKKLKKNIKRPKTSIEH